MEISVRQIRDRISDGVDLELVSGEEFIDNLSVKCDYANVMGLELNGYLDGFQEAQIQVINRHGMEYFRKLDGARQSDILSDIFSFNIPALIFAEGEEPDERFINLAQSNQVALLKVAGGHREFVRELDITLSKFFAPVSDYRGTMMEIFGIGVLISGKTGVGKSECAVDLIQRGHRLIGDDIIEVVRRGRYVVLASGKFPISNKMELRGLGIVDIVKLYGISAIKDVQKIDLIVELERWDYEKNYERLGLEERKKEVLGVDIPYHNIPVASGRNTAILVEVAAMNFRLRRRGIVPARELEEQVLESIREKGEDA